MAMKTETVDAFIAEAEKELASILRRKAQLEDLIKNCKALFSTEQRQQPLPLGETIAAQVLKSLRRDRGKKIWEQIVDLLKEVQGELSISEIVQGFQEREWPLSPKNASKIIYRAMRDKPDIFIHTSQGTWDLKERFRKPTPPPQPIRLPEQP
jgi:hypothetical protein